MTDQPPSSQTGPPPAGPPPASPAPAQLGRRRLLQGAVGGVAVGALAGAGLARAVGGADRGGQDAVPSPTSGDETDAVDLTVEHAYYGQQHQPGVATKPQRYAAFMTFDLVPGSTARDLQALLARWSAAIAQLMKGQPIGTVEPVRLSGVPQDTGEAAGLEPAALTVTVGLGPSLFDGRLGLAARKPALLAALPALPSDQLHPDLTGGDLSVQACADDPQVAYHAVRNLARMARDTVRTGWTVMGFGRASAGVGQQTPRNLMGFKDGTRNVKTDEEYEQFVWLEDAGWMTGGTYQVVRKIEMDVEIWDAASISTQHGVFGRTKTEGAPLSGTHEHDVPDFTTEDPAGNQVIPPTSHVALAAFENNGGTKILRRGYNYTEGLNDSGQLNAGLLFIAFMNDPAHFVALQRKMGRVDQLNEYISHIGSGVWAVPPAPAPGHYLAQDLFA